MKILSVLLLSVFLLSGCVWASDTRTPADAEATRMARSANATEVAEIEAQEEGQIDCVILGNISRTGEKIYHVPGGLLYSRVKIDLKRGEQFFCSEAEAQAAGWRKSLR
jgi:hypothetical protein